MNDHAATVRRIELLADFIRDHHLDRSVPYEDLRKALVEIVNLEESIGMQPSQDLLDFLADEVTT